MTTHGIDSAAGVTCQLCTDAAASHKVEEVTDEPRHPFTAYVCCGCFATIMGPVAARACSQPVD